ncbi:MAG TPA: hypothetical protein VF950_28690 [Planctomycetota bacterium]
MPARHCVFVLDLAELEKAFQAPLSQHVAAFLDSRSAGDRLREYAELAFANEEEIQALRKGDRETMVMARRLITGGQDPRSELPRHLQDVTADYLRTRTASQFKWFIHMFSASGLPWAKEVVCGVTREWVEEAVNLLFTQRGFSSTPEEGEEFKQTRQALLRLSGPFPLKESGREVDDPQPVTADEFPSLPREDGVTHFRMTPAFACPTVARTLSTLDLTAAAFQDAGRTSDPRLQGLVQTHATRLRSYLQLPYQRPTILSFIGA